MIQKLAALCPVHSSRPASAGKKVLPIRSCISQWSFASDVVQVFWDRRRINLDGRQRRWRGHERQSVRPRRPAKWTKGYSEVSVSPAVRTALRLVRAHPTSTDGNDSL